MPSLKSNHLVGGAMVLVGVGLLYFGYKQFRG